MCEILVRFWGQKLKFWLVKVTILNNYYRRKKEQEMLTILFLIFLFGIFGKLFFFGIRAAWGISKFVLMVVFFPVILLGMLVVGLVKLAFPLLLIFGVIAMFGMDR